MPAGSNHRSDPVRVLVLFVFHCIYIPPERSLSAPANPPRQFQTCASIPHSGSPDTYTKQYTRGSSKKAGLGHPTSISKSLV
ncbi:hypothetical protein MRB53_020597 [Persea americana]|uniref:Uncharacterized protein n=1 Tax=Persea americana TaxID=3435 RepID=A0ACC2L200_PERAE|nr:hypothetical protein MRB53_020597 [Persea americana]